MEARYGTLSLAWVTLPVRAAATIVARHNDNDCPLLRHFQNGPGTTAIRRVVGALLSSMGFRGETLGFSAFEYLSGRGVMPWAIAHLPPPFSKGPACEADCFHFALVLQPRVSTAASVCSRVYSDATHNRQLTIFQPAPSAPPLESAAALDEAFWSADPHTLNQAHAQDQAYFTDSGEDSDGEDGANGGPRSSRSGWASPQREGRNAQEDDSIEAQERSAPAEANNVLPKLWGALASSRPSSPLLWQ